MTKYELEHVTEEWETALALAEEALAASRDAFTPAEARARIRAIGDERREATESLAALARLLHLRFG